jgi:hypothetical protein
LNKVLIQERRKNERDRHKEQDEPPLPTELIEDITAPVRIDSQDMVQFQERETIRLLLNYASQTMEDQKVSDFFIHELEDVEFTNPTYKEIYEKFKDGIAKNQITDSSFFLQSGSEAVKRAVTDLITHRYETSQHWGDKFHILIPKESDILSEMTLSNVLD